MNYQMDIFGRGLDLTMSGIYRYQRKELAPFFGYDVEAKYWLFVEWAILQALADIGFMPEEVGVLLTPKLLGQVEDAVTQTSVDKLEGEVTKHDIRALCLLMTEHLPTPLHRYIHFAATSFDIRDTAASLIVRNAFEQEIKPKLCKFRETLAHRVLQHASVLQIGRTHGQHALPITVGFWLATVLNSFDDCAKAVAQAVRGLRGKVSGAVGCYNAQELFNLSLLTIKAEAAGKVNAFSFEELVLQKLGLEPAPISTQILPAEPMIRYLFEMVQLSGVLAQLGRDCRQLQRTEIAEVAEKFAKTQSGSSAMPHKRNPIASENTEGLWRVVKALLSVALDNRLSEHQRDLTASAPSRILPTITILVYEQLCRMTKLVTEMAVDQKACRRNFDLSRNVIMAEPLMLALRLYGFAGDAHQFINHELVPQAIEQKKPLCAVLEETEAYRQYLSGVWDKIPAEIKGVLCRPELYIGLAREKAREIAEREFCID